MHGFARSRPSAALLRIRARLPHGPPASSQVRVARSRHPPCNVHGFAARQGLSAGFGIIRADPCTPEHRTGLISPQGAPADAPPGSPSVPSSTFAAMCPVQKRSPREMDVNHVPSCASRRDRGSPPGARPSCCPGSCGPWPVRSRQNQSPLGEPVRVFRPAAEPLSHGAAGSEDVCEGGHARGHPAGMESFTCPILSCGTGSWREHQ